jgi:hypothetical protein
VSIVHRFAHWSTERQESPSDTTLSPTASNSIAQKYSDWIGYYCALQQSPTCYLHYLRSIGCCVDQKRNGVCRVPGSVNHSMAIDYVQTVLLKRVRRFAVRTVLWTHCKTEGLSGAQQTSGLEAAPHRPSQKTRRRSGWRVHRKENQPSRDHARVSVTHKHREYSHLRWALAHSLQIRVNIKE